MRGVSHQSTNGHCHWLVGHLEATCCFTAALLICLKCQNCAQPARPPSQLRPPQLPPTCHASSCYSCSLFSPGLWILVAQATAVERKLLNSEQRNKRQHNSDATVYCPPWKCSYHVVPAASPNLTIRSSRVQDGYSAQMCGATPNVAAGVTAWN